MQTFTPFRYRPLPLKVLYLSAIIPYAVFFKIPLVCLAHVFPFGRPRNWPLSRTLLVEVSRIFVSVLYNTGYEFMCTDATTKPKDAEKLGWVPLPPVADKVTAEILALAQMNNVDLQVTIGAYWFGPRGSDGLAGQTAGPGEKVLMYLHGGAFIMAMANDSLSKNVINTLITTDSPYKRALSVEYRVASSAPYPMANAWPTQVVDALAGYVYLLSLGFEPKNVVVMGDSAGGPIIFALTRYLVNHPELDIQLPGGLLLLSPSMDFTVSSNGPDSSFEKNQATDAAGLVFSSKYTVNSLRGQMSVEEFSSDPLCSPGSLNVRNSHGWFKGMPPTFIHACDGELALDSIRLFRDRMWEDNGKDRVVYVETKDVTHDLLAQPQEPELTEVKGQIAAWLRSLETI